MFCWIWIWILHNKNWIFGFKYHYLNQIFDWRPSGANWAWLYNSDFGSKNISNFVSLTWKLHSWYCHIIHLINLGTYQCSNIRGLGNVVIYNLFISSLANMSTLSENCPSSKAIQSFSSFSSRTYWHSTLPVQIFRWPKQYPLLI